MGRLPHWLVKPTPKHSNIRNMRSIIGDKVHTVCESAKCPNIGECYSCGTVTFMVLGDICTRSCSFCGVNKGKPLPPDPDEPRYVAEAASKLNLKHVVVTSVTRDDLPDGGASHFARTICELRTSDHDIRIEVLIPDFGGDINPLKIVIDAQPDIINHNIEMTSRLYGNIRPKSNFERSMNVLKNIKKMNAGIVTKSGFMLGLGETEDEVKNLIVALKNTGCSIITIGQYIPPSQSSAEVVEYIRPEKFEEYKRFGLSIGIEQVISGPFVRSSYMAGKY